MSEDSVILQRTSDKRLFRVTEAGHWSTIETLTGGECDLVKCLGMDEFVSHSKGHTYILVPNENC